MPPDAYAAFPSGVDPIHHAVEEVEHLKRLTRQVAAAPAQVAWAPLADTYAAGGP